MTMRRELALGRRVLLIAAAAAAVRAGFTRRAATGGRSSTSRSQGNTPYDGRFVFVRLRYDIGVRRRRLRPARRAVVARLSGRRGALHRRSSRSSRCCTSGPTARTSWRSTIRSCSTIRSPTWRSPASGRSTRDGGGELPQLPAEGRVHDLRRLPRHDWDNLQDQMRGVLPEAHWIQLDGTAQVFHSFFEIDHPETLTVPSIYDQSLVPSLLGAVRGQRSRASG